MSTSETYKALIAPGDGKPRLERIPFAKPGTNQIIVQMEYAPINLSDVNSIDNTKSSNKTPDSLGLEGSGVIVALGTDLKVRHKVGDRVHVIGPGTLSQYILTNSENCIPILGDLSLEEAASHFLNPGAAVYMGILVERGKHKAVVHAVENLIFAKMLVRYFKKKGIKLINVVRHDKLREELNKDGADYALSITEPNFEEKLKEVVDKEKATIAFDSIGNDLTGKIIKALPNDSVCYMYGSVGEPEVNHLSVPEICNNKSLSGFHLNDYLEEVTKAGRLSKFLGEVHSQLSTILKSPVQNVFKLEDFQKALSYYKENFSKGEVLLKLN